MARIGGANVLVVAVAHALRFALASHTFVPCSAGITVVALALCRIVLTGPLVVTKVDSTWIAIIAIKLQARLTGALYAMVIESARVAIGAGDVDALVLAATSRLADVLGAGILVVTVDGAAAQALAVTAMVIGGAGVEVVARCIIGVVIAAEVRIAQVISAGVTVVTRLGLAGHAASHDAGIALSALVPIVAGVIVDLM
jgi:hypothetical protein